ncbi:MAG: CoA-binding protein [Nanoarchaeota archaeon]|nr:CoA-binding protein [Nanoarchaeota archaeon]
MNIAILGASNDKKRMSNKAVRAYKKNKHKVYPVNPKYNTIEKLRCYRKLSDIPETVDTISVYVNPELGLQLANEIILKKPEKVILNPGSENDELIKKLKSAGLTVQLICSIQALGEDPKNY